MDVYAIVTERIIEALEKGTVPWQCPWKRGEVGIPKNGITKKAYRGINPFLLNVASIAKGYSSPYWVSFKQAKDLGGSVRAGEKSPAFVVFYRELEIETDPDENGKGETKHIPMLRYTPMFNADQCEGLKLPKVEGLGTYDHKPIDAAQKIVDGMPDRPELSIRQSNRAYYSPSADVVVCPELSQFARAEDFYSTLFHELGHSTGHKTRLGREFGASFGDHTYSKEELVAEFTASYLCGVAGIEHRTIENSASYLDHWLSVLKDQKNRKWLVWAASQAQKAADFILGNRSQALQMDTFAR